MGICSSDKGKKYKNKAVIEETIQIKNMDQNKPNQLISENKESTTEDEAKEVQNKKKEHSFEPLSQLSDTTGNLLL